MNTHSFTLACLITVFLALIAIPAAAQDAALNNQNTIGIEILNVPPGGGSTGSEGKGSSVVIRPFPIPQSAIPGTPGTAYFGTNSIDNFVSQYETVIPYQEYFSVPDGERMIKKSSEKDFEVDVAARGGDRYPPQGLVQVLWPPRPPNGNVQDQDRYKAELAEFNKEWIQCGTIWVRSKNKKNTSDQVFGRTIVAAGAELGAMAVVFREGARLRHDAGGWSIGLNNSFSFVSPGGAGAGVGNVASGGTGFGKAHVGPVGFCYMRAVGYLKNPNYRRSMVQAPKPRPKKAASFEQSVKDHKEPAQAKEAVGSSVVPPTGRP